MSVRNTNRVIINLEALYHNIETVSEWMKNHDLDWTLVTKVLCGHKPTLNALIRLGIKSVGDSRIQNLEDLYEINKDIETWYLRIPSLSELEDVVTLADVSLNTETQSIKTINEIAAKQNKVHKVIIMIELGDLREGILPGSLMAFYKKIFNLKNVRVIGIGTNFGCLAGAVPTVDQFMQLILYRELLELKFGKSLPIISAGSSVALPMLLKKEIPKGINHFRIGESIFLGTDLISSGNLPGLRDDCVTLESDIIEIKEKSLNSGAETSNTTPFESEDEEATIKPGQRGYRALLSIGQLDTEVSGLIPENPEISIAGSSSDVTVVNIGDHRMGFKIGKVIRFKLKYSAMARLMANKYIDKVLEPSVDDFFKQINHMSSDIGGRSVLGSDKNLRVVKKSSTSSVENSVDKKSLDAEEKID
ncbi:MAG: alanine racemase [Deltaproteobacteria bacterium]|jgi:predicted amino acid racemase|nr:alanine racemase [Deltaproteobacteria bacterium]